MCQRIRLKLNKIAKYPAAPKNVVGQIGKRVTIWVTLAGVRYTDTGSELVRNMIKSVGFPKMTNTLRTLLKRRVRYPVFK